MSGSGSQLSKKINPKSELLPSPKPCIVSIQPNCFELKRELD
jgi:hypothetical protein